LRGLQTLANAASGALTMMFGKGVAAVDARLKLAQQELEDIKAAPRLWPGRSQTQIEIEQKILDLTAQRAELVKSEGPLVEKTESAEERRKRYMTDQTAELEKQKAKIQEVNDKLNEKLLSLDKDIVSDQIQNAIDRLDYGAFEEAALNLRDIIGEELDKELADAVKMNLIAPEAADIYKKLMIERAIDPLAEKWLDKQQEVNKKAADDWRKKHEDAYTTWLSIFENQFSGETFNIEDALRRGLAGFAAELAASIAGGIAEGVKSVEDVGKLVATGLLKGLGQLGVGPYRQIGTNADGSPILAGTSAEQEGYMSAGIVAAMTAASAVNMEQRNRETGSAAGYGATGGTLLGGTAGAILYGAPGAAVGAQLGQMIGGVIGGLFKEGANVDTQARHDFAGYIEKTLQAYTTLAFRDLKTGGLQLLQGRGFNFLEQPFTEQFSTEGWATDMNKWGADAFGVFTGLGQAIKDLLGITEDVGGEMAYMLGENLSGNIDNARLLVAQLGLSFEELAGKLEEAALRGEIRWAEYNVQMAGLNEAFEPGLVAVGAFDQALRDLEDSGGRGMAAVLAFKNVAVEAMEAGATSIEDLQARLLATGADPEVVNALVEAVRSQGITTLEEWANASNTTAGTIVGNMEAISKTIAQQWQDMQSKIDELQSSLAEIPSEIPVNIVISVTGDEIPDELTGGETNVEPAARGAVISGPHLFRFGRGGIGLLGEAGPEAILPLKKINGRLGVTAEISGAPSSGMTVNIDARGAQRGVETAIRSALSGLEDRVIARAVAAMADATRRGYY
jgi:hypothetical protein